MSSALTQRAQAPRKSLEDVFRSQQAGLEMALADRIGVDRFIRAAVTTFRTNTKLQNCTQESILGSLFLSAQLGLEVGGPRGLCYIVPYGKEATFVLGFKGVVELFYRTGQVRTVDAFLIREGDVFVKRWDPDRGRVFEWEPRSDDAAPVGAVAYVVTTNGGLLWEHMTAAEILKRRPSYWTGGPWEKWPDQMWLKTVLKALPRKVRMSSDDQSLALAVEADQTVQRRLPGLPDHVVEHVPVGGQIEAATTPQEPAERLPDPTPVDDPPMAYTADPTPADDDWEARDRAEHAAWIAEQEEGRE